MTFHTVSNSWPPLHGPHSLRTRHSTAVQSQAIRRLNRWMIIGRKKAGSSQHTNVDESVYVYPPHDLYSELDDRCYATCSNAGETYDCSTLFDLDIRYQWLIDLEWRRTLYMKRPISILDSQAVLSTRIAKDCRYQYCMDSTMYLSTCQAENTGDSVFPNFEMP